MGLWQESTLQLNIDRAGAAHVYRGDNRWWVLAGKASLTLKSTEVFTFGDDQFVYDIDIPKTRFQLNAVSMSDKLTVILGGDVANSLVWSYTENE